MRLILITMSALALGACAAPQGVIKVDAPLAPSRLTLVDERPVVEKQHTSCRSQGPGWNGIADRAFSVPRLELLRAHLNAAFGGRVNEVRLQHFQSCSRVNSRSGAAGLAGISYGLALAVDAAHKPNADLIKTYIDLVVDGVQITGSDVRTFEYSPVWMYVYEKREVAEVIARSTEEAIDQIIGKLRKHLDASPPVEGAR